MPTAVLQVICGATPLDLLAQQILCEYRISKNIMTSYGDFTFNQEDDKRQGRNSLQTDIIRTWQRMWDEGTKGRITNEYLPNIDDRLRTTHIKPRLYVTQAITGHGNMREYLWRFSIKDLAKCRCGDIETMDDRLFICDLNRNIPRFRDSVLALGHGWPPTKSTLMTEKLFDTFAEHAEEFENH